MEIITARLRILGRHAVPALLVGVTAVAGSFVAAGYTDQFVGGALATIALDILPPIAFVLGIEWLGAYARPLLAVTSTMVAVVGLTVALALGNQATEDSGLVPRSLVTAGIIFILTFLATRSPISATGATVAGTLAFVAFHFDVEEGVSITRRRLLRSGGILAATLGVGGLLARRSDRNMAIGAAGRRDRGLNDDKIPELLEIGARRSFDLQGIDPLVSEDFYQVDINVMGLPQIQLDDWSLRISGEVARELELTYDELTRYPTEHRFVTLRCVSDELNSDLIDTALWTGTPLAPVLDAAGVGDDCCVRLEAEDGYYHAFPREALERGFLAWGMNGKPLPVAHGAPVRVLIPGHWGEINVKWLTDIEIRDEPATSWWEKRGWHGSGPVETVAKLRSAERDGDRLTIGGHAYAGVRGISRVEVSTDGDKTWDEVKLSDPLPVATPVDGQIDPSRRANDAWRMWRHAYENPGQRHDVTVRAYDRDGNLQPKDESEAFPRGATGWVTATIDRDGDVELEDGPGVFPDSGSRS